MFPVMEWSTNTKNGSDDLDVYMEYRYVFVSSTGRNLAKMSYNLFNSRRTVMIWEMSWSILLSVVINEIQ